MGQDDQVRKGAPSNVTGATSFEPMLALDIAKERRIFWYELAVGAVVAFALLIYLIVS
jgi:uncharacterized membrane protein